MAMKPGSIVFLVFAGLGMLGYLCYGWLLLETLSSEKGLLSSVASVAFTNLFILWLLPLLIDLVLLALKLVKRKQH